MGKGRSGGERAGAGSRAQKILEWYSKGKGTWNGGNGVGRVVPGEKFAGVKGGGLSRSPGAQVLSKENIGELGERGAGKKLGEKKDRSRAGWLYVKILEKGTDGLLRRPGE